MDLVGYLFGTISAEERCEIEAALLADPALRAEYDMIRKITQHLSSDDDIEPPAGLADRTIALTQNRALSAARASEWASNEPRMRLVDVCMVAAVLLFVAIIVLPAIASARGEEGKAVCADNLRAIAVCVQNYRAIENGQFPTVEPSGPMDNAGVFALMLQARDLLPQAKLLICPMADSAVVYVPRLAEYLAEPVDSAVREMHRRQMGGSYGYTLGHEVDGVHRGPGIAGDRSPLVADRPPRSEEQIRFVNSPNHGGMGENVLFADGHVQFLTTPFYGQDAIYKNASGRMAAGHHWQDTCIGVSESVPYPELPIPR